MYFFTADDIREPVPGQRVGRAQDRGRRHDASRAVRAPEVASRSPVQAAGEPSVRRVALGTALGLRNTWSLHLHLRETVSQAHL